MAKLENADQGGEAILQQLKLFLQQSKNLLKQKDEEGWRHFNHKLSNQYHVELVPQC